MSGPQTGVNLSGADLRSSDLSNANLWYANLGSADLSGADLRGAYEVNDKGDRRVITGEGLEQQAKTLERATMPDGQMYENWLKNKGREDGS